MNAYDKGTAHFHGSGESLWLGKHYDYCKVSVRLIEDEKKTMMGNLRNLVYSSRRQIAALALQIAYNVE